MCKNLSFDDCMLTGSGNRLPYPSCTKLKCRQLFREFQPFPGRFEHYAHLISIIINCLHPSGRKEIMKIQSIFKDLIVKLFQFRSVLFGFVGFVSFRFVDYNKPSL